MRAGELLRGVLRTESTFWRKALQAGVVHGPDALVRYSPRLIGVAFGAALPRERRSALQALRRITGKRPAHQEVADVAALFANFASAMTDAMLVGTDRGYRVDCRPVGGENFVSALESGSGVILATGHTCGWDVAGAAVTSYFSKREVVVVMEPEANDDARQIHDEFRRRQGVTLLHAGRDPLGSLALLGHLRKGHIVAMKFDRVAAGMRTRRAPFLGGELGVPDGLLRLAALTGAPIVPVFTRRLGFLRYEVINCPVLRLPRRPTNEEYDAAAATLTARLEEFVRAYPTQWFRFRD